jgi:metallo-beta-lactamase family protein
MNINFYGGVGMVTGSNFLLESDGHKILVDCGLYQGTHFAEKQNFEPFPYEPSEIEAVFVTHAHLDHVGRLPKLIADGFRGTIYSTHPTKDFAELILLDSEHILAKEAEREGRQFCCDASTIRQLMAHWKTVDYHAPFTFGPFKVQFFDAGHILGSAIIVIEVEGKTIAFTGDLGNSPAPIVMPTERLSQADYCVIEGTYGGRQHPPFEKRRDEFEDAIEDVARSKGVLIIPAFALERTQELLYHLNQLVEEGRVPRLPVFIDSPLAIKLTSIYKKYEDYFNKEASHVIKSGDDIWNFPGLRMTLTTEESKEIEHVPAPKIVIAGSGMSHGGRILHHEMRYLSDPKNMLLFVGYQAVGSLGRRILDGANEVTIFGEKVHVRCKRRVISSYSAHADEPRLLDWISPLRFSLKKVFPFRLKSAQCLLHYLVMKDFVRF